MYGAIVPVQQQRLLDGGMGTQHPAERTRDQECRQPTLAEANAEAETKREVGANDEEVKLREDK